MSRNLNWLVAISLTLAAWVSWACSNRNDGPQPPRLSGLTLQLIDRAGCPNNNGVAAARYALRFEYNGPQGLEPDSLVLLLTVQADGKLIDSIQFYNSKISGWKSRSYPYRREGDAFELEFCLWHNDSPSLDLIGTFVRPDGTPLIENRLFYSRGGPLEISSFRIAVPNPRDPFRLTAARSFILTLNDLPDPLGGDNFTSALIDVEWLGEENEFLTGMTYIELSGQLIDEEENKQGAGPTFAYFNAGVSPRLGNLPEVRIMYRQAERTAHRMSYPLRFGSSAIVAYELVVRVVSVAELPRSPLGRLPNVAYFGTPTVPSYSLTSLPLAIRINRPAGAN